MTVGYRSASCALCDEVGVEHCPRCNLVVCKEHRLARWCTLCERERIDERSFSISTAQLRSPKIIDTSEQERLNVWSIWYNVFTLLVHAVTRPIGVWRAGKTADAAFARRSSEEIDAWRATNARGVLRR